ncbi:UPF0481 protein At3g47200-like [Cornus florida]|uniref:UPF0481 protein At3g47200-like n=1 Tax=Cornus florida TaxID=4283 RepID=UPI00289DA62B|nr:UPF0481 protein At3g47200-like [Cornus florida]
MDALICLEYGLIDDLTFPTPCIHRIPDGIRELNKTAYNPSMVSIGPLHRAEPHLQAMEAVKSRYMDRLLSRAPSEEKQKELKNCCEEAVSKRENCARKYYAEDFSEAMPSKNFRYNAVRHDLLLFENQIPFLVLQELFWLIEKDASERNEEYPSLTKCLLSFFEDVMGFQKALTVAKEQTTGGKYCSLCLLDNSEAVASQTGTGKDTKETKDASTTTCCHILHLLHKSYTAEKEHSTGNTTGEDFKYSAAKLKMAGVKLEAAGNAKTLLDVRFRTDDRSCVGLCKRGRFEIPPFCIYDHTEPFFRNIIAFEQSCPGVERYFTSLALLMDKLINSPEDVELLEEAGIIHNHLGSSEEVSVFFNNICKNVSENDFCFKNQCIDVNSYCKRSWPKFLVKLRQDYFSNPWTIISVIAAIILFALTLLQTIYTLLSYY